MASVNINYISSGALPPDVRQQIEELAGTRIMHGSQLCIAMLGDQLLGAASARPAERFARIDFLHVSQRYLSTRLAGILLSHLLKQLHKVGVNEVTTAALPIYTKIFLDFGFMEENISIPGMHSSSELSELIQPNLESLQSRFKLIGDAPLDNSSGTPPEPSEETKRSIRFDTMASYRELCRMVLTNSQRKVFMLCENLDDPILNDRTVVSHIQDLVLHSRQVEVRLLLENDRHRPQGHSPILDLAHRLSSFVSIRRIHDQRISPKEWLYLADDAHAVVRKREHGFKGQAHLDSQLTLQRLGYQYENLWQHSIPSSELRRLAI